MKKTIIPSKLYVKQTLPTVISLLGVLGVIGTTCTAINATPKALQLVEQEKIRRNKDCSDKPVDPLTVIDIVSLTWKCYIPTAVLGLATISCILGSNALNKQNQTTLASAYALINESYKKYRISANETFGPDADSMIKAHVVKTTYVSGGGYYVYTEEMEPESEKILFYDFYSKRYFYATIAMVLNAQYHINRNLALRGHVSVNEFYSFIQIEPIEHGGEFGWDIEELTTGGTLWLDFENTVVTMDDGLECCIVSAMHEPISLYGYI